MPLRGRKVFPRFPNGFLFIRDSFSPSIWFRFAFTNIGWTFSQQKKFPTKFSSCLIVIHLSDINILIISPTKLNRRMCVQHDAHGYILFLCTCRVGMISCEWKLWQSRIRCCTCRCISSVFLSGAASVKNLQRKPDTHVCAHDAILNFSSFLLSCVWWFCNVQDGCSNVFKNKLRMMTIVAVGASEYTITP